MGLTFPPKEMEQLMLGPQVEHDFDASEEWQHGSEGLQQLDEGMMHYHHWVRESSQVRCPGTSYDYFQWESMIIRTWCIAETTDPSEGMA
jgi:hypothetical protein